MTAERTAEVVDRWVRRYTRDLPASVAERRREEIRADLHDEIAHERARGTGEARIALALASRMLRGVPADARWRQARLDAVAQAHPTAPEVVRRRRRTYRRAAGTAVGGILVLVWMVGAVGIIGTEGDDPDRMYAGVLAVGIAGAVLARFRAAGMARVLLAMAVAQAAVAVIALVGGLVPAYNSPAEIVLLNAFFVGLFARAAQVFPGAAPRP